MKRYLIAALAAAAALAGAAVSAQAGNVINEWAQVKAPPPPALKPVTVDLKSTALLMLDFVHSACNMKRRPRCIESVPTVKKLLAEARGKNMMVLFTAYGKLWRKDVLPELAPDLEKILKDKGIQSVIVVGTAAHGAVITTASASADRGFKVIVAVDGISSETTYAEQYTVWHLVNAPVIASKVTLTKVDMIKF
jgi:nicotinamidase-related amidase